MQIFGARCTYGQVIKSYAVPTVREAPRRYSPGQVVAVEYRPIIGEPSHISTSYVERSNLTIWMARRRFTRLTNAFSNKLTNHAAATSLFVALQLVTASTRLPAQRLPSHLVSRITSDQSANSCGPPWRRNIVPASARSIALSR